VIDCDVHNQWPSAEVLLPYLDPPFRDFLARGELPGPPGSLPHAHRPWLHPEGFRRTDVPAPEEGDTDDHYEALRTQLLDRYELEYAVLTGEEAIEVSTLANGRYATALARAYNDWLVDFCQAAPRRLIGAGILPADDPALATEELQRVARHGLRHVVLLAAAADPPLYHPAWEPFWAAAAETRIPIGLHLLVSAPTAHPEVSPLAASVINGVEVPLQLLDPLVGLIYSGVMARHPDLRLVLAESGIAWLPYVLQRMDNEHRKYVEARAVWEARGWPPLECRPSEYFHRQVWATFQDDAVGLGQLATIGEDRVMWASDYPHPDSTWPHSQQVIAAQMADLPEPTRRRVTCENARALYALDG